MAKVELEAPEGAEATEAGEEESSTRTYVVVTMPPDMKAAIEAAAKAQEIPVAVWARRLLASEVEYLLPEGTITRARKYSSDEERKQAQKARQKDRNQLIKGLLAQHRAALAAQGTNGA